MSGSGRDAADDDQRNAAAKNGQALVAPWPRFPCSPPTMPRRRPGLLTVRLTLVRLPVRRLAWIWLLLPIRLLRRIRRLTLVGRLTLPLVRVALAVRIPWRLLAHDALPCTAPSAVPSRFKKALEDIRIMQKVSIDTISLSACSA